MIHLLPNPLVSDYLKYYVIIVKIQNIQSLVETHLKVGEYVKERNVTNLD